jgi:hypothetical protein
MTNSFERIAANLSSTVTVTSNAYAAANSPNPNYVRALLEGALQNCKGLDLDAVDAAQLVPLAKAVKAIAEYSSAIHAQIELRAIANGISIPGAAVKDAIVHRAWHDQGAAEQLARETFGDKAFTCALKSPAQIEKLDGGDVFVAVAAYKPPAGKKVVY